MVVEEDLQNLSFAKRVGEYVQGYQAGMVGGRKKSRMRGLLSNDVAKASPLGAPMSAE